MTISLIGLAILGIILQFNIDFNAVDKTRKKKYGIYILILSIVGLLGSNINQHFGSISLKQDISELKTDNSVLKTKLDSAKIARDSILIENKFLQKIAMRTELKLNELNYITDKGFQDNQQKIESIKRKVEKEGRRIPKDYQQVMIRELSRYKGKSIEFNTVNTSEEALRFSSALQNVFTQAGWSVSDVRILSPNPKHIGIVMESNAKYEPNVLSVYNALSPLNYKITCIAKKDLELDEIKIFLGFQE